MAGGDKIQIAEKSTTQQTNKTKPTRVKGQMFGGSSVNSGQSKKNLQLGSPIIKYKKKQTKNIKIDHWCLSVRSTLLVVGGVTTSQLRQFSALGGWRFVLGFLFVFATWKTATASWKRWQTALGGKSDRD